jgi:hypothetical protein
MRFWNNDVRSNRDGVPTKRCCRNSARSLPLTPPSPRSASLRRERE